MDIVLISSLGNPAVSFPVSPAISSSKSNFFDQHPIHKHSNKAWIIGQGHGSWIWNTVAEAQAARPDAFNLANPPFRDGFRTLDAGLEPTFTVMRFVANDAG